MSLGAGASALGVVSTLEPILLLTGTIIDMCIKVSESLQRVKSNSNQVEALQIRVTLLAKLVEGKQSSTQSNETEMSALNETENSILNSLLKTLTETFEWVERREIKEATQAMMYQIFRSRETMEKIKAFDERLTKHMVDLNVELKN